MQRWDLPTIEAPHGARDPVVLAEDEGARAVLVVLQPGQGLGEHQVRENTWIVVVAGSVHVTIGTESFDVDAGTLLRFDPAERHALSSATGARILLILAPWPGDGHYPTA